MINNTAPIERVIDTSGYATNNLNAHLLNQDQLNEHYDHFVSHRLAHTIRDQDHEHFCLVYDTIPSHFSAFRVRGPLSFVFFSSHVELFLVTIF